VACDAAASCPTWDAFLQRIMNGNQNLISFLQRAVGYALTGVIREHVLPILWGDRPQRQKYLPEHAEGSPWSLCDEGPL
jgi:hypothetical protein